MLWRIFLTFLLAMSAAATGSADVRRVSVLAGFVDWPSYNHDLTSQRYAGLNQITGSNVGRLHVICTARLGGPNNFQSGPIVVSGVLFVTRSNQTIAMSGSTCRTLWINTYGTSLAGQTHGVTYAGGTVFRGFANGHVIAINATTGTILWDTTVIDAGSYEYIDAAPVVWNGMLFIGTADGEAAQVCHMLALDQKSGRLLLLGTDRSESR
jgi:alcohol dehydrogenase (cytochrome c)